MTASTIVAALVAVACVVSAYLRGRRDGRIEALASIEALKALIAEAATRKET